MNNINELKPYPKIVKTVYNNRLLPPDSYTVECGGEKARANKGEEWKIGAWLMSKWQEDPLNHKPGYVYYNIGRDCDHILYCKYELIGDEFFPAT